MIRDAETLRRLCRIVWPEDPVPHAWCAELAQAFAACDVGEVEIVAYLDALSVKHARGAYENPAVHDSLRTPHGPLRHFGSAITLVVEATSCKLWFDTLLASYADIGVPVCFAVGRGTSAETARLIVDRGARYIDIGYAPPDAWSEAALEEVGTKWVLIARDDEIPSPAMLMFADRAVEYSPNFIWGFPRVHCSYDSASDEVRYSQFLPFGPLAASVLHWRMVARSDGPKERRAAPAETLLFSFDWIVRSFAERIGRLPNDPQHDGSRMILASFELPEGVPETWHLWTRLPEARLGQIVRLMHRSKQDQEDGRLK
ncbi:hypothetical protein [Bauldia litoralis]|uniref:Uncharacterized protein n=1 Tax=Bauldia litoralis TaxID=665467 RepID=A0A1G6E9R4_9HYPH|nr:hypothetical protein [Bauldia litoralis]SDB54197.1 hypothetical protein SAMN02982931_04258 [Bauldia litoralis]